MILPNLLFWLKLFRKNVYMYCWNKLPEIIDNELSESSRISYALNCKLMKGSISAEE